ncbi:FkbM family methyltransferase [uncultured Thiocystis sp.]|jgi:FkbM family methyltransferase|uniref:FkbM family methyltransferase n=1 Tax=uncultured Thiocystis sp. TaxID=1202134 RepID=UPI0025DF51D0|nr:FkbM family methyltransferase [uncultured Thiocystis sp.]
MNQEDAMRMLLRHYPQLAFEVVFDVGANCGQSTAAYLSLFPQATIFAFEPSSASFQQLSATFAANVRVSCHQLALADHSGTAQFTALGTSVSNRIARPTDRCDREDITVTTGDAFCQAVTIDRINYLKIDTEGHDLKVLHGFSEWLSQERIDFVEVEAGMHPLNDKHALLADLSSFMESFGYFVFHLFEQAFERHGRRHLRRANVIYVSDAAVHANLPKDAPPNKRFPRRPASVSQPPSRTGSAMNPDQTPSNFERHHPYPVVVMSFNRPDYLDETLTSLKAQQDISWNQRLVCLFQDGGVNFHSGTRYADDQDLNRCVEVFRDHFPKGIVRQAPFNLGIGLNFNRAEHFIFHEKRYAAAMFFEDDMALGPHYLWTMDQLLDFALSERSHDRVGYVAAYGDHRLSLDDQARCATQIIPMGHSWGFGLTRRHWLEMIRVLGPYLSTLAACDYKQRRKSAILDYYESLGLASRSMSQDAAKHVTTIFLNRIRLMPVICQARYIGKVGSNFTEEIFLAKGYGNEQLYLEQINEFDWPSQEQMDTMLADERRRLQAILQEALEKKGNPLSKQ